jgi:glucokinase
MLRKPSAIIALDLGGTKLASAFFTADDPKPRGARSTPIARGGGDAVGTLIVREVRRLRTLASRRGVDVHAVGVSVPGIVNARTGDVWAPNIPGWDNFPLRRLLREAEPELSVVVDSDRSASIVGEAWQGAARGCRDAVFLAVGTGIGAGILAGGRVLRGAHGIAGAIGWLALDRPFRPEYVSCGCFEHHASGEGLAKVAKSLGAKGAVTARDVFAAYARGDAVAKKVLRQAVEFWGLAAANLVSVFNPEKVIFGGGVFGPAAQFLDAIAAEARRWAQPVSMRRVTFEASQLGPKAALYGAAYLALRRVGKSHVL